jgi:predicted small lipoprotein YifL
MRYGIIMLGLLIAGCGQKGALFMPNDKPNTPTSTIVKPVVVDAASHKVASPETSK